MRQCMHCGSSNNIGNIFCNFCGQRIVEREKSIHSSRQQKAPTILPVESSQESRQKFDRILQDAQKRRPVNEVVDVLEARPIRHSSNTLRYILYGTIVAVGITALVFVLYSFVMTDSSENRDAILLYNEADQLHEDKQYDAALSLYEQFRAKYPDNPLANVVQTKIGKLRTDQRKQWEIEGKIAQLVQQAQNAYMKQEYLTPANSSAHLYVSEILAMDPENSSALAIRQNMVDFYNRKARISVDKKQFLSAQEYCENVLTILPDDRFAKERSATISDLIIQADREKRLSEKEVALDRRAKALAESQRGKQQEQGGKRNPLPNVEPAPEKITTELEKPPLETQRKPFAEVVAGNSTVSEGATSKPVAPVVKERFLPRKPVDQSYFTAVEEAPASLIAALIIKVAALEQKIASSGLPAVIFVLGAPDVASSLRAGIGKKIGTATLGAVLEGDNLPQKKPTILYIGNRSKTNLALIYAQAQKILSVSAVPSIMREGVSLGIGIGSNRKPLLLVNRSASQAEGCKWAIAIEDIATLYN